MSSNQVVECQYHVVEKKVQVVEKLINPKKPCHRKQLQVVKKQSTVTVTVTFDRSSNRVRHA